MVYITLLQAAIISGAHIRFHPSSIFTPPSEACVGDAGPRSEDLIQLGFFFSFLFSMTGVYCYETDEQNVQPM